MMDLFGTAGTLESLPLPDAELLLARRFYTAQDSAALMAALHAEIAWRQESIVVWNQARLQPRLSAWYGDDGSAYRYSGRLFRPLPWTPTLSRIRADVEGATGHRYNSVLLNLYRDGNDSVGWHSDDEPELGSDPVIASVSLGQARTFRMRHRRRKDIAPCAICLDDGSLLLMKGATQRCWRHAVPKETKAEGARINMTFRFIRG